MCSYVCVGAQVQVEEKILSFLLCHSPQGFNWIYPYHFHTLAGQGAPKIILYPHPQHEGYKHMWLARLYMGADLFSQQPLPWNEMFESRATTKVEDKRALLVFYVCLSFSLMIILLYWTALTDQMLPISIHSIMFPWCPVIFPENSAL